MFNTLGLDPDFIEELELSYANTSYKKEIVSTEDQLNTWQAIFNTLHILYNEKSPKVVNAFKVELPDSDVIIIQTYIDEGHAFSMRGGQKDLGENIQGWAYVQSHTSIGNTMMRPELISDKLATLFGKRDINFSSSPAFSKKYHLLSTEKTVVEKLFNKVFLDQIGQADNLQLIGSDKDILISFPDHLYSAENIEALISILSKANFLTRIQTQR